MIRHSVLVPGAHCISCRAPLRWPPRRACRRRAPHYDMYRQRPVTGLSAMVWDLLDAAERHEQVTS